MVIDGQFATGLPGENAEPQVLTTRSHRLTHLTSVRQGTPETHYGHRVRPDRVCLRHSTPHYRESGSLRCPWQ